ncbi:MAG: DnaD domain protein, partial [Bacilli bacterium]|nr:DnaD domain protein [Bacilli bacterium]
INFEGFENISTKFSDIYRMTTKDIDDVTVKDIKKKDKLDIMVDDFVDFSFIEASLSKSLGNNFLTDKLKKLINKLAYLYNYDNMIMSNIILNSLNDKGEISESELKKNSKNYYLFENKGKTPKLIYSSKINKEENKPENTREELISCFENASPYDFLKARYKGAKPTKRDTTLLEGLLVDQELQPGVINVLIDYVLRTNDKKLNNNYVEAIASQWKMLGITSVEDAMKQAKKEFNKKKKVIEPTEGKKVNTLPNWYDKKIERNDMSIEEEKELKEMLKEFE